MSAQTQYLRALSCKVGSFATASHQAEGLSALDFARFRIQFQVRRGDWQTPNSADVRIFNVSAATASALTNGIANGEFQRLVLSAGYPGNIAQIFDGTITQVRVGRLDQKDSYVDLTAQDGDEAYNYSTIAQCWAAGQLSPKTAVETLIAIMGGSGSSYTGSQSPTQPISGGYGTNGEIEFSGNTNVRGRVMFGMARDEWREFARNNNLVWSIQDGQLTLIPETSYIPGQTTVLSPSTGLIGVPEQTPNGVKVRTLLNPLIKIGTLVQIQGTINQARQGLDQNAPIENFSLTSGAGKLNASGSYYVMSVDHSGDTRGQDWYSDLVCMAVNAQVPFDAPDKAAIFPGNGPMPVGGT